MFQCFLSYSLLSHIFILFKIKNSRSYLRELKDGLDKFYTAKIGVKSKGLPITASLICEAIWFGA
jgi:hypothetical protein